MTTVGDPVRERALQDYRKKLLEHKEVESRLKESELLNELFCMCLVQQG
jgi:26S proteasome regulatory subunit T4